MIWWWSWLWCWYVDKGDWWCWMLMLECSHRSDSEPPLRILVSFCPQSWLHTPPCRIRVRQGYWKLFKVFHVSTWLICGYNVCTRCSCLDLSPRAVRTLEQSCQSFQRWKERSSTWRSSSRSSSSWGCCAAGEGRLEKKVVLRMVATASWLSPHWAEEPRKRTLAFYVNAWCQ